MGCSRYKFRAWDTTKKEMFAVSALTYNRVYEEHYNNGPGKYAPRDETTLMQYTGLKDINNVEIYEGDVVSGTATQAQGGFDYLGKVVFYNQSNVHGYYVEDNKGGGWSMAQIGAKISLDHITGKVIGNVHEHPELIQ